MKTKHIESQNKRQKANNNKNPQSSFCVGQPLLGFPETVIDTSNIIPLTKTGFPLLSRYQFANSFVVGVRLLVNFRVFVFFFFCCEPSKSRSLVQFYLENTVSLELSTAPAPYDISASSFTKLSEPLGKEFAKDI